MVLSEGLSFHPQKVNYFNHSSCQGASPDSLSGNLKSRMELLLWVAGFILADKETLLGFLHSLPSLFY